MGTVTKVGDFTVRTVPSGVIIIGSGEVALTPGELKIALQTVNDALRFTDMKLLPPQITYEPFRVKFSKEGDLELLRLDDPDVSLKFTFAQGDDLVKAISEGVDRHVQEETLGGGPSKVRRGMSVPDPLI